MRKIFTLMLCLTIGLVGMSQQRLRPQRPEPREWPQRYKQLNLSAEQKRRIIELIQRQRLQKILDQKALEEILTPEQKKKLQNWKEDKLKNKTDSTSH